MMSMPTEAGVRGVDEGAVGIERERAVGRAGDHGEGEVVAVGVQVVGQDAGEVLAPRTCSTCAAVKALP